MFSHRTVWIVWVVFFSVGGLAASVARADEPLAQVRISVSPTSVVNESKAGDPAGLVDEQDRIIAPPAGRPTQPWTIGSQHNNEYPFSSYIDLGKERRLATVWIYDTNGKGNLTISTGTPGSPETTGHWEQITVYDCGSYMKWVPITIDRTTRYVRFTRLDPGANFTEVAFYEYTDEAYAEKQKQLAAAAKAAAEKAAAMQTAAAEMRKRPLIDAGAPFGKLYLIDEIDCAAASSDHPLTESAAGVSRIETILGKPCRVLSKTDDEGAFFSYRIGKMKLLQPGAAYVLEVEYPEDQPRSWIVISGGNEISRGFHTGATLGDAMHPKYVNNLNESISTPLSGKYESWKVLFNLHDRSPELDQPRGNGVRPLISAEDGFNVTIAQFSAKNIPVSHGAAVSKIRLFGVEDPSKFDAKYTLPKDLPRRRLFWREEMADGVIGSEKPEERGVTNYVDWWAYKRNTMKFLGMNTYTKDLLEFGACQHWDSTDGGANDWVYFNAFHKNDWEQIVTIMGEAGFDVFPYYEYSGSKGKNGLGPQKRAKPLTRDDAYTHIAWNEKANADLTDPDTYADFKKMLDLTVLKFKEKANFAGVWLRPRSTMQMGFADPTLARFVKETKAAGPVTRKMLIADKGLLAKYESWWFDKRREFLTVMRDYLRENGIKDAMILYTTSPSEPGVGFDTWEPLMVTDDVPAWQKILARPEHLGANDKQITPLSWQEVAGTHKYLEALLAAPKNWGGWELNHSSPQPDPVNYQKTEGVMMEYAFNRLYTVADPKALEAFRGPSGLAIVRHFSLNENMMFDKNDKPILGYFVVDFERAGPYCMMSEAMAVANGDPDYIGYLSGSNYARGFPEYVRNFNTAFLSLPALPSVVVPGVASDKEVVVRMIRASNQGVYYAIVNTGMTDKANVTVKLAGGGKVTDAATGEAIDARGGKVTLTMYPFQLRAVRVK